MSSQVDKAIKKRVKHLRTDVLFSKKAHYNAAAIWGAVHYTLGILAAGSAAFVGVKNVKLATSLLIVLSVSSAILVALSTFLKPQDKANQHKQAGDDFDELLQMLSNFNDVDLLQGSDADHSQKLNELTKAKTTLNKASLQIPKLAYLIARDGIHKGEAAYSEDI